MKKIIAIVMALVMMMAVTVPAFAADTIITKDDPAADAEGKQTAGADVVTTFDATNDWSYTVTIPADINVSWGDTTEKNMTYSVESQLLIGASLDISAVVNNNGDMTNPDTTETLTLNITGGDTVHFAEVNPANTTAPNVVGGENVKVAIESFDGKPVGTYTGTLTFTVVYNAPNA